MLNKNLLKSMIVRNGYTQEKLAEVLGMSANTLSSRITGTSSFNLDEIDKICEVLNIVDNNEKADIFLSPVSQNWDSQPATQPTA